MKVYVHNVEDGLIVMQVRKFPVTIYPEFSVEKGPVVLHRHEESEKVLEDCLSRSMVTSIMIVEFDK